MKIEKLKKINNGKYKVKFDNNEEITIYDEIILKNNLLINKEVDNERLEQIILDNSFYDIYNKVLKYISIKVRSEKEIDEYIKKYDLLEYSEKIKTMLRKNNLINDISYMKAYVYDKVNLSSDGPNKIFKYLKLQDIDDSDILSELDKYKDVFYEKLNKLMNKKICSNHTNSRICLKNKLLIYFIDLGYDKSDIIDAFDKFYKCDESIIEKEYSKLYNKYSKKYEKEKLDYVIYNKLYLKGFIKEDIDKIKK